MRVRPSEKKQWAKAAAAEGVTLSRWLADRANRAVARKRAS
jgi:hypothetical protein